MNKFQLISSFILLTIFVEILIIIQFLYHDWSTSIDVIVSIIAFLAFFGGYAKLMDYFKSKPNLKIENIDIIQDRTHVEFTIKNNGNAFSNNPLTASTPNPSIAYAFHEHIYVRSNAELEAVASSGTGTAIDPYLIEELNITTPFHEGILIRDTTKHFIIQNCLIDAEYGISISAITEGTATIRNNLIQNSERGLFLINANSTIVSNNTFADMTDAAIWLQLCHYSSFTNNTMTGAGVVFMNEYEYYYASQSPFVTVSFEDNTVNGLPMLFLSSENDLVISETYGQITLVNCTNVTVKDQTNENIAMSIHYSSNCIIENSIFESESWGIPIIYSNSNIVRNNTITGCAALITW